MLIIVSALGVFSNVPNLGVGVTLFGGEDFDDVSMEKYVQLIL